MNKHMMIHESALGQLLDFIDVFKKIAEKHGDDYEAGRKALNDYNKKKPMFGASSIAKATSDLTLVFPVICSRGISIENSSMVTKALEKNFTTMLQQLIAASNISSHRDVRSFIKDFHGNMDNTVINLDDIIRMTESVAEISATDRRSIMEDMKNIDFHLPDAISETALTGYTIYEGKAEEDKNNKNRSRRNTSNNRGINNTYDFLGDLNDSRSYDNSTTNNYTAPVSFDSSDNSSRTYSYNGPMNFDSSRNTTNNNSKNYNGPVTNIYGPDPNSPEERAARGAKNMHDYRKGSSEYFKNQVLDTDFKKANELMPTVMVVNFKVESDDGKFQEYGEGLIGVKAKLYPIASDDVIRHIADTSSNRNWLTNFFRATTREISFVKDFVLALDKAKLDAMSFSVRGNNTSDRMWKVLERRALNSHVNRSMRVSNNSSAAAITTLCISQEEVEYLRKHHSLDLERIAVVRGLFESLNLICICIVDETLEVVKFIYDTNDPSWETVSFTHLERESSDNTYKRVVNLMTKVSR